MAEESRAGPTGDAPGSILIADSVSLYYQIAAILREKILSGDHRSGERLATQHKLAEEYGVSRLTAREALQVLEEEGLVKKERGRGTFVTYDGHVGDIPMDRSIEDLISMGMATSVKLLDMREEVPTAEEARLLELGDGERVLRCRRLRFIGEEPYCYIVNTLPLELGGRIDRASWEAGSILKVIEDELGIPLGDAEQRLRATLADPNLARWLEVRIGAPLLRVDYLIHAEDSRPVERAFLYYRSDLHVLTLRLTRTRAGGASPWSLQDHRIDR